MKVAEAEKAAAKAKNNAAIAEYDRLAAEFQARAHARAPEQLVLSPIALRQGQLSGLSAQDLAVIERAQRQASADNFNNSFYVQTRNGLGVASISPADTANLAAYFAGTLKLAAPAPVSPSPIVTALGQPSGRPDYMAVVAQMGSQVNRVDPLVALDLARQEAARVASLQSSINAPLSPTRPAGLSGQQTANVPLPPERPIYIGTIPVPSEVAAITRNLRPGMTGEDVRTIQRFLASQGDYIGLIDGVYGPLTKQGVGDWQLANNIPVAGPDDYGYLGPITRSAMVARAEAVAPLAKLSTIPSADQIKKAIVDRVLGTPWNNVDPDVYKKVFTYDPIEYSSELSAQTDPVMLKSMKDLTPEERERVIVDAYGKIANTIKQLYADRNFTYIAPQLQLQDQLPTGFAGVDENEKYFFFNIRDFVYENVRRDAYFVPSIQMIVAHELAHDVIKTLRLGDQFPKNEPSYLYQRRIEQLADRLAGFFMAKAGLLHAGDPERLVYETYAAGDDVQNLIHTRAYPLELGASDEHGRGAERAQAVDEGMMFGVSDQSLDATLRQAGVVAPWASRSTLDKILDIFRDPFGTFNPVSPASGTEGPNASAPVTEATPVIDRIMQVAEREQFAMQDAAYKAQLANRSAGQKILDALSMSKSWAGPSIAEVMGTSVENAALEYAKEADLACAAFGFNPVGICTVAMTGVFALETSKFAVGENSTAQGTDNANSGGLAQLTRATAPVVYNVLINNADFRARFTYIKNFDDFWRAIQGTDWRINGPWVFVAHATLDNSGRNLNDQNTLQRVLHRYNKSTTYPAVVKNNMAILLGYGQPGQFPTTQSGSPQSS
ncbi:peptidoglycan-binding protein, partial [Candidatus Kaiserbacteria bacterium]|nr:peptidoglycan-binding protein [Candidatus Kaiserbacteria bacterium]